MENRVEDPQKFRVPYDPETPLLEIGPKEMKTRPKRCPHPTFTAASATTETHTEPATASRARGVQKAAVAHSRWALMQPR